MKFSIVLSTQPARFAAVAFKGNLETNLSQISALGYDGVELAVRDPRLINLAELTDQVNRYHLGVPAIGTGQAWGEEGLSFTDPDPGVRKAAVERILSHFPLASQLGAVVIIGLIRGIVKPGVEPYQAMDWLIEALQTCCQSANSHGVKLALEPINRYETTLINNTAQGLELVQKVGADNFGLLLDTFHMNIEEASMEASILACGPRIFHFHVADSNRWYPGAGHLNFKKILATLAETGYPGYVSGEFMPLPDAETAARQGIASLQSYLFES